MRSRHAFLTACALALAVMFSNCTEFKTMPDINSSGNQNLQSSSGDNQKEPMHLPVQPPAPSPVVDNNKIWPNEPAGFKLVTEYGFDSIKGGNGWINLAPDGDAEIFEDMSAPVSPPAVLRDNKQPFAGHGGTGYYVNYPDHREIFFAMAWKSSDPFHGYPNGANKILFFITNSPGSGGTWGLHYLGADPNDRFINVFVQSGRQDVNNCHVSNFLGQCDLNIGGFVPNVDKSPITPGVWHKVEVYFRLGKTTSSRDCIIKVWVDNKLKTQTLDANCPTDWPFNGLMTNHTWDGQYAGNPTMDNHFFDHIYISEPSN